MSKGTYKIDKIFSNQFKLDTAKARQIYNLLDSLSISSIPTDNKIKGWQKGFDGNEIIIELSTKAQCSFQKLLDTICVC